MCKEGACTGELRFERVRVYGETLLLPLPYPDFSMPFNVIALTCTLLAFFFGSVFNMLYASLHTIRSKHADVA